MEIGNELKSARERKRLSIDEVSREIKMSKDKIKALEEENFGYFPGKFYARSFLKSYASYLGLAVDVKDVIPDAKEQPIITPLSGQELEKRKSSSMFIPKKKKKKKKKEKNAHLSNILGIVILSGLISYGLVMVAKNKFGFFAEKNQIIVPEIPPEETKIMLKGITRLPTWVLIVADGKQLHEGILAQGTTTYWAADETMKIRIGYVRGIDIYYRGTESEDYRKIDIIEGSVGDINELDFFNDPSQ